MSRVWFEVSSLVGWSGPLTGMQRVTVSLILEYIKLDSNTGLVTFNPDTKCFYEMPESLILDLASAIKEKNQGSLRRSWRYRLKSFLKGQIPESLFPLLSEIRKVVLGYLGVLQRFLQGHIPEFSSPFHSGDKLIALDVTWGRHNYIPYLPYFKEKFGLEFFHLIHDIIPIKFPHYYEQRFSPHFREHIRQVIQLSTGILVYSDNSKKDIYEWSRQEGLKRPQISRIHLGSDFESIAGANEVSELVGKKYCLYVSTLEIRKNHILLLKVWKRLIESMGDHVPFLVFAGRRGWMIQETLDFIKENSKLTQKLIWLQNTSDSQLDWLYQNCYFTLYPSSYEGWGLPIIESLARGKLCLASSTASMPEAGQNFVIYFDPNSEADCSKQIMPFILSPELVTERENFIKINYLQTRWSETAADLYDIIRMNPNRPTARLVPSKEIL